MVPSGNPPQQQCQRGKEVNGRVLLQTLQ